MSGTMMRDTIAPRQWLLRSACILFTVVGLFAMHGLSMNHSAAAGHEVTVMGHAAVNQAMPGSPQVVDAPAAESVSASEPSSSGSGALQAVAACVALLTAFVLLARRRGNLAQLRRHVARSERVALVRSASARYVPHLDRVEISICRT